MKTLVLSILAALLIASLAFSPVAAAAPAAALSSSSCGDTYVVQPHDYLALIASNCGTTVASILALNPQITNASLIYTGQVLRLTSNAPITYTPTYLPYTNSGSARVSVSATRVEAGDDVTVYVSGFPASTGIDYRVGISGSTFSEVYDGTTNAYGADSQVITIPTSANAGEYWVVQVITTDLKTITSVTSASMYVVSYNPYTGYSGYAKVSLSATRVEAGDDVTVYVSGFPANAEIDYRVGVYGQTFNEVYDGTINSSGSDSQVINIPADADVGEYWYVQVITTSLKNITSVTSSLIYVASYNPYTGYSSTPSVSLSRTSAKAGDQVTVYVSGFPANAQIDYRLGLQNQKFSVVYDGVTNAYGSTAKTITIPTSAAAGSYWTVLVITTSLKNITSVTSHTIYITN